jgi:RNA polymerase sigma-70 factor (ECF subfamily)
MFLSDKSDGKRPHGSKYGELAERDDPALMREVLAGNGDALAVLFDRYQPTVLSIALRILRDRGEAEDVLQAIFLEIFQSAAQFDPARGKFSTWIMQYAYHRSINRRNYLLARQFYTSLVIDELTETQQGLLKLYSEPSHECARFVRQALLSLDERQRRTIEMVHFEGLSLREIAAQQQESFSNVRHHYYRGLAKLKQHLKSIAQDATSGSPRVPGLEVTRAKA